MRRVQGFRLAEILDGDAEAPKAVRDSKDPEGGVLALEPDVWAVMVSEIKRGAYDL
ncbi:protein of unknown function [Actinomadura meyerae]|uniref:DUF397 domain-containing protein n=1 Tax=Actinomadura meyerae TaxID=240840 RepID=A0A239P9K7_9ACTN|nr:protein of unknown function [Actinomadura meyerae]